MGLCAYCSSDLPRGAHTGRPRRFCSSRCQVAASRLRRSSSDQSVVEQPAPSPDAEAVEAFLVGRSSEPDDQVLAAVHETLLLVISYRRLGVEARRQFAWRCSGMADAIEAALQRYFRDVSP